MDEDPLDATGELDWDSASLLHRLVTSTELSLLKTPPETCLELGAGTGAMAVVLAEAWKGSLRSYIATDLDVRIPALRQRLSDASVASAAALPWGSADSVASMLEGQRPLDLVLMADLLYWNGSDIFEPDLIEPLSDTLAAALAHGSADALAVCAFRERWAEREHKFVACCEDRGLRVQRLDRAVVTAHSPACPQDADVRQLAPGKQSSLAALLIRRAHREDASAETQLRQLLAVTRKRSFEISERDATDTLEATLRVSPDEPTSWEADAEGGDAELQSEDGARKARWVERKCTA